MAAACLAPQPLEALRLSQHRRQEIGIERQRRIERLALPGRIADLAPRLRQGQQQERVARDSRLASSIRPTAPAKSRRCMAWTPRLKAAWAFLGSRRRTSRHSRLGLVPAAGIDRNFSLSRELENIVHAPCYDQFRKTR